MKSGVSRQDAKIAEKDKDMVKSEDYLLPKTFNRRGRGDRRGSQEKELSVLSYQLSDRLSHIPKDKRDCLTAEVAEYTEETKNRVKAKVLSICPWRA